MTGEPGDIRVYLTARWRWRLLILAFVFVILAAVYGYVSSQPKEREGHSTRRHHAALAQHADPHDQADHDEAVAIAKPAARRG